MGPENEGKPSSLSSRPVDGRHEALEDIESLLVKTLTQMDDTWASDLFSLSNFPCVDEESKAEPQDLKPGALSVLSTKLDNVKLTVEVALLKLRQLMVPRQKASKDEDVNSNLKLKRSRPLSPLHVPRLSCIPGSLDTKVETQQHPQTVGTQQHTHGGAFDITSPAPGVGGDMLPLKFIRTGDNTKAAFQKPSTIYMPTAKLGVPPIDPSAVALAGGDHVSNGAASVVAGILKPTASGCTSPKTRPSRSRRDRNRTRSKVVEMPEPIMQKLEPGDPNKIPDDGYLWRKYGNKPIKTASYKRGYYKCRHFKEVKCLATKIVQQTNNDPSTFSVCYKGEHTCRQQVQSDKRGQRDATAHSTAASLADYLEVADPKSPGAAAGEKDTEREDLPEGIEWPSQENSADSSDDMFAPSDTGDEAVESAAPSAAVEHPASPALLGFRMPSIGNLELGVATPLSGEIVEPTNEATAWVEQTGVVGADFIKGKYDSIETCPPDDQQQLGQDGLIDLHDIDDNDQLLKMINGGLWDDHPSDINYWYHDIAMESLPSQWNPSF